MENTSQNLNSAGEISLNPTDKDLFTNNMNNLRSLIQSGVIPMEQGQNYIMNLVKNTCPPVSHDSQPTQSAKTVASAANNSAASSSLAYLQKQVGGLQSGENNELATLLSNVAEQAMNKFKLQLEHNNMINLQNENVKQRLTSNIQSSVNEIGSDKIFSRDEIGKMSMAEFLKHEQEIMAQMRAGKIK